MMSFKVGLALAVYCILFQVESRKLILKENTGFSLRKNVLYVPTGNRTYQIVCSPPNDVKSANLTWVPTPNSPLQANVSSSGLQTVLTVNGSADNPVMEFNCTDQGNTLEMVRFRFYRSGSSLDSSSMITGQQPGTEIPINIANTNNTPIVLTCKSPVDISTSPIIWFLDDRQLFQNSSTQWHVFDNGTLIIQKPSYQDVGVYMCRAQVNMSRIAFFNVTGNVIVQQRMGDNTTGQVVNVTVGSTVKMSYMVYGNPINASSFRWKRTVGNTTETINDGFINAHPEFANRIFFNPNAEGPNAELELRNITKNDTADYTFSIENAYGNSNFTSSLKVNDNSGNNNFCSAMKYNKLFLITVVLFILLM